MGVIRATAYPNELTKDVNNDYYLLPQVIGTLYEDDIIRRLEAKEIATKNVNGKAFVQLFLKECALAVSEGYNVVTSLFRASANVKGVIYTEQLGRNVPAGQVNIRMNLIPGVYAREEMETNTTVQVAEQPAPTGPVIQRVVNPVANETDTLNTGAMVLIQGLRLAVRGDKEGEIGIFFTNPATGETVHIPVVQISPNTPSKLQFVLPPDITPGEWKVAVGTQATSQYSKFVKEVRQYEYPFVISVV